MRTFFITGFLIASLAAQYATDIRFVRYYASEMDFVADNRLMATGRTGTAHLQVFFNDKKRPVLKEWVDEEGNTQRRKILEYDGDNRLFRRYDLDKNLQPFRVTEYGENEPWGVEFRKVTARPRESLDFKDQQSIYTVNGNNQIESILFRTVSGYDYGEITFFYDHLGMLVGEDWRILPEKKSVRKYAYAYELISGIRELVEYNQQGEEVSRVVLALAPEDQLYKYPPPRTGNRLDEVANILEDIRGKDVRIPFDVFIPETDHDIMGLYSGERMEIKFIAIEHKRVKFKFPGTEEILVMPLSRVNSISDKFGEDIYP